MPKNTIIMIGDGMGWEMARAAAIAKQMQAGSTGNTLNDYYTAGKGTGSSFQNLTNYALSTTYGTTIADGDGKFSTGNSALDNSNPETGASYVRPRFGFNPAFNPGNTATGGALESEGAVGNLVGYDPARGGSVPWQPGNDPEYIKWSYPDSANTATTLYTGVKSYNNAVAVDIYEKPLQTILGTANQQAKSTGLVSSVPIDHATPGAAAANVNRRAKYDDEYPSLDNILQQELRIYQPNVLLGGGHPLAAGGDPLPVGVEPPADYEFVTQSTYEELSKNPQSNVYNYNFLERGPNAAQTLAEAAASLSPEDGARLLGLYGARGQNGNIPVSSANGDYSTTGLDNFSVFRTEGQEPDTTRPLQPGETDEQFIAKEVNENPTLADMTEASLEFLGKDSDGFWLMVEGGDIDWSAHDDNMDNLLGTMRDFDKAVESTINWINENGGFEENLLIVTADHDHYLTLNENFPQLLREQGAETLTDLDTPAEAGHFWGSDPNVKYGWGSHTNRPVPVYYQGEGSEVLNGFVGEGYNAYGYDIPGIPGLVDQTHIYQTMYQAVVNQDLVCGEGDDVVLGLLGEDDIVGNAGNDFLAGNEDQDFLDGGDGNDTLRGGKDADTLTGGNGDDVLYGDMDDDLLSGGEGADRFVLTEDGGVDTIVDFQAGIDVIEVAGVAEVTSFAALSIAQSGNDAVISAQGQDLATLNGIQATTLVSESFVFA